MGKYIAVDFDKTLCISDPNWRPGDPDWLTGPPVPLMVKRVKQWLAEGKEVRILTARAYQPNPKTIPALEAWCLEHIGQVLIIQAHKCYDMEVLYDDKAIGVEPNTGKIKDCPCSCWCAVGDFAEDDEEFESEEEGEE